MALLSEQFFSILGELTAILSSFLYQLQLHKLLCSLKPLLLNFGRIILSWTYFAGGYISYCATYTEPWIIYCGTILLGLVSAGFIMMYQSKRMFKYDPTLYVYAVVALFGVFVILLIDTLYSI